MKARALFFLSVSSIFLLIGAKLVRADCGEGVPPKYQFVVVWNGVNGFPGGQPGAFDSSVEEASRSFGAKGQAQWLALGGFLSSVNGEKQYTKAAIPSEALTRNAKVVSASIDGLEEIAKGMNREFELLKSRNKTFRPDEVQLVFVVTNHGTVKTGKNGKSYGVATDPRTKSDNKSDEGNPQIDENDLTAFASKLPAGIRVKAIFGQCFGANTMDAFFKGLRGKTNSCVCGTSAADIGQAAIGIEGAASWEVNVMTTGQGKSLIHGVRAPQFKDKNNLGPSSSELFLYKYFLAKASKIGIKASSGKDVLKNFQKISDYSQKNGKPLNQEDASLVIDVKKNNNSTYYPWMQDLNSLNARDSLKWSEPRDDLEIKYKDSNDPLIKDIFRIFAFDLIRTMERDHAREEILKSFLTLATDSEKAELRSLMKCERDPLDAAPPLEDMATWFKGEPAVDCQTDVPNLEKDVAHAFGF